MTRNPCHGWADGDKVTYLQSDKSSLATGIVVVRKSHKGQWYLKVCLKTAGTGLGRYGEWVWPEGWVWGRGSYRGRCFECGQEYLTNDPNEATAEFCPPCERRDAKDREQAGTTIRNHVAYAIGSRDPQPDRRPQTKEELTAIAAQKARDDNDSPF